MAILTRSELSTLVQNVVGPCVSIFMPTHANPGTESKQDPIRLKNHIREARERLIIAGLKTRVADQILEPANTLLTDDEFWRHQREGLAVFASRDLFRMYRLPLLLDSLLVVGERFFIKPMLPLLTADGRFYILAVSQKDFRFFQCTRYTSCEIDVEDVPKAVVYLMEYDERERYKGVGFHPSAPSSPGRRWAAVFHGQTLGAEHTKKEILEHFQRIDRALSRMLANEQAPLVLAAVDYLHPLYAEANTYPHLLDPGVQGNPDDVSGDDLHRLGWAVAEPYFARKYGEKASLYKESRGTPRASNEIRDVVAAAYFGRVDSVFVSLYSRVPGSFQPETGEATLSNGGGNGAYDLLDLAAAYTLMNRGDVFVVKPEDVPDNKGVAAYLRY